MGEQEQVRLDSWLRSKFKHEQLEKDEALEQDASTWIEIRLFLSSTFVDTQAERDVIIKNVIPSVNRKLAPRLIRIVPVDLRWGVLSEESKDCYAIQKTCLNQLDKCRQVIDACPWFLGLRTDRYGWVQDKLMPDDSFENSTNFHWYKAFEEYEKHVSITSLECIHATIPPRRTTQSPTIFFYERNITNPENIEANLRWVFEYEYIVPGTKVDEEVKFQYEAKIKAEEYQEDKQDLDDYMKSLEYVKWASYDCKYEKGGARITIENVGRKSFGVGYVSELDAFGATVEKDLLDAVEANFSKAHGPDLLEYVSTTIQHENAMAAKAKNFVGRTELLSDGLEHCTSKEVLPDNNVLIFHGEPGCGKSGLMAKISSTCVKELRKSGDFVFVHAVDACPGSNILEFMLRRLQLCLRKYRKDHLDETNLSYACPQTAGDLKIAHHDFLKESATKYPDKLFVILVDAVNQFHDGLQAWKMWWLPSGDLPKNLRVVITTLEKENGTYNYACEVCPDAIQISVDKMSKEDRQTMVSETLLRFNKKLTTTDAPYVGNQMELLLSKNASPLYLVAAAECLRRFGIFEKVTEYIAKLPANITELFSSLLDEWVEEYTKDFTHDVAGLLSVSKDGLLENEINDILLFKEEKLKDEDFRYQSSFSRLYDSICSFLAAGGGGYLRFFHDTLKRVVKDKFLTSDDDERTLHQWLADFFSSCISPQLCEQPAQDAPAYYDHCLQQLVHHQLRSIPANEKLTSLDDSLRNIYFVRERVVAQQQQYLNQEYLEAIKRSNDQKEIQAFKDWARFVQLYSAYIAVLPQFAHNMAVNQAPTSYVAMDTNRFADPEMFVGYPLYWTNIPTVEDEVAVKYTSDKCFDCIAARPEKDLCCLAAGREAFLFEKKSGDVIHQVRVEGYAVSAFIPKPCDTFWIGDRQGRISLWNADSGTETKKKQIGEKPVIWMESIGQYIACGTGEFMYGAYGESSSISIIDGEGNDIKKSWLIETRCYCYCFHAKKEIIFSGHDGGIKGWNLDGGLVMNFVNVDVSIRSLNPHPEKGLVLAGSREGVMKEWKVPEMDDVTTIGDSDSNVLYNSHGNKIMSSTTSPFGGIINIYNGDGKLQNELKGHSERINKESLVPGSEEILTAGNDGSRLFNIPSLPDPTEKRKEEEVIWCAFLQGGEEFVTLSFNYTLRIWTTISCTARISTKINVEETWSEAKGAIHPNGEWICIGTGGDLRWYDTKTLDEVTSFKALEVGTDAFITDMTISPDGMNIVLTAPRLAVVFNIEDIKERKEPLIYSNHKDVIYSCDIHEDNIQVVTGATTVIHIWHMVTGKMICKIDSYSLSGFVRFLPNQPELLLHQGSGGRLLIRNLREENNVIAFLSTEEILSASFLRECSQLLTIGREDGRLRIFDVTSGRCVYTFVEHRARRFVSLTVHPSSDMTIAGNKNGMLYALNTKREKKN